jgi:hypothetical protein
VGAVVTLAGGTGGITARAGLPFVAKGLGVGTAIHAPMVCSRDRGEHWFTATVTAPRTADRATRYTVRIDGVPSGKIAAFGLNNVHDMTTDYAVPPGAKYVAGSARIVPDTGTPNVTAGARASYEGGVVRMILAAKIPSGSGYTPPSLEFQLEASAPAGTSLPLVLLEYRVTANAIIVGDVLSTCDPVPKPLTLTTTTVTDPPAAPPPVPVPVPVPVPAPPPAP